MTSGTSDSMRKFFALLRTNFPACANASSTSPATTASSAEKTIGALTTPGSHAITRRDMIESGGGGPSSQRVTSPYFLPADRSDAASSFSSNHGWSASRRTNICPTAPVAPSTATGHLPFRFLGRLGGVIGREGAWLNAHSHRRRL